jgi:hypothetical protein
MFYQLEPEVAGHLGSGTVMDASTHPPVVDALHYEFDGWPADDLIEAFPCFIVTDRMRGLIEKAQGTGCRFGPVRVSTSDEFEDLAEFRAPQPLPQFSWLIVSGTAGRDDFGTSSSGTLIVSDRILQVMKQGRLENCDVSAV